MLESDTLVIENTYEESQPIFEYVSARQAAWSDFMEGMKKWRIWLMLSHQDIKLRYRRSILGPFWLTISMAITVYSMGYLYSRLFHIALEQYYPFLVTGMLAWSLISTIITEYTDGFVTSDGLIKQMKLPYTLHIHRIICRNIIIFFHNLLVMIPIIIIFNVKINFYTLLLIPNLIIIYINAISFGLILAMIGGRYRDISQVIRSLVQVIFFVTPVMWKPDILSQQFRFFIDLNPFYAFVELIRQPLLGDVPTLQNIFTITIMTFIGIFISAALFIRYRKRIIFWL